MHHDDVNRRASASVAALLVAASLLTGCGDDDGPAATTTTTASTVASSTTSTTASATTETTGAPATSTTTAAATGTALAPVSVLDAGPSAGSGEIRLGWSGVAGAEGYRLYRADAAGGPFELAADLDVATGTSTTAEGVTNVWSPAPGEYEYIEFGAATRRYFRVTAYDDAGETPPSAVVCGAPTGQPDC